MITKKILSETGYKFNDKLIPLIYFDFSWNIMLPLYVC